MTASGVGIPDVQARMTIAFAAPERDVGWRAVLSWPPDLDEERTSAQILVDFDSEGNLRPVAQMPAGEE